MDNEYPWAIKVEAALGRVRDGYREAAEAIDDAMKADPTLTQALVSEAIGKSTAWVSRLMMWYGDGCSPEEGPFAAESANRRALAKLEEHVASTQSAKVNKAGNLDVGPDRPWLPGIEGGPTDAPPPDESVATALALSARNACQIFGKSLIEVTREMMLRVYRSAPRNKRRALLTKLAAELEQSIALGEIALGEVRATLKESPRVRDDKAA